MRFRKMVRTSIACWLIASYYVAPCQRADAQESQHAMAVSRLATQLEQLAANQAKQTTPAQAQATPAQANEQRSGQANAQSTGQPLDQQLPEYVRRLRQQANQASTEAWSAIKSLEDWHRFRDDKLTRLRESLGQPTSPRAPLSIEVTSRYEDSAGRFVIENILYQSRPGVWITANLYRPAHAVTAAPGLIISHAHHTPKEHAELQAMGMTWARAGCYVLVPDHFGHGERRQHSLVSADSFPSSFRVSRQDYYFRYDNGIKLHLLGESLMSWLAWDLSRGADCLLAQPGIDPNKIILLGSVAGGGDPCAVAAALDERIAAAVPFNFGGPQPETPYPLPDDAQSSFNYAGSGSWESTRNLTSSVSEGFLPWVIVGSIAPRRVIYAHEFRWDQEHDPVWQRLQSIYKLYDLPNHLDFTHGRGELRGQPPEATHCTHIGAFHRQRMHDVFRRWFDIDVSPAKEIFEPLQAESLRCLRDSSEKAARSTRVDFEALARDRISATRAILAQQPLADRRRQLQMLWTQVLGHSGPSVDTQSLKVIQRPAPPAANLQVESLSLSGEDGMQIPLVLLLPPQSDASKKRPVVLIIQTAGKAPSLTAQSQALASLLAAGHAVCVPDLRGTGESRSGSGRGRSSAATSISSSLLMSGDPLVAGQLRDLRSVWSWLRMRPEIDPQRMQVWADSRRPTVTAETDRVVPRDDDSLLPPLAEPSACLLALLLSLYEDSVHSLCLTGSLNNFCSALGAEQIRLPHDCILPGLFRAGDIEELIVQAAERWPTRCESFVDGHNRSMALAALEQYHSELKRLCPDPSRLKLAFGIDCQASDWLIAGTDTQ